MINEGSFTQNSNLYLEGKSVYAKEYQKGEVELRVKKASKSDEKSEHGEQKWVYTLETPEGEQLPDGYAEANLSEEKYEQGYVQVPHSEVLSLIKRLDRDGT